MSNEEERDTAWIEVIHEVPTGGPDYRWAGPVEVCLCGSDMMAVLAIFDEGRLVGYFLDMKCVSCGALLKAPTPIDEVADELS
jgi:hypothetical protein